MTVDEVFVITRATVAETFGVSVDEITRETVAEDVDGWDSLSHTILMLRLGRVLDTKIPEEVAADAATVGDLSDKLANLISNQ